MYFRREDEAKLAVPGSGAAPNPGGLFQVKVSEAKRLCVARPGARSHKHILEGLPTGHFLGWLGALRASPFGGMGPRHHHRPPASSSARLPARIAVERKPREIERGRRTHASALRARDSAKRRILALDYTLRTPCRTNCGDGGIPLCTQLVHPTRIARLLVLHAGLEGGPHTHQGFREARACYPKPHPEVGGHSKGVPPGQTALRLPSPACGRAVRNRSDVSARGSR